MINEPIRILSTRPLDVALLEAAALEGIGIEALSFISTQAIADASIGGEIADIALAVSTVVFTSRHAVEAVVARLGRRPQWQIFCTGHATRQLAEEHFGAGAIAGIADSAGELAEKIIGTFGSANGPDNTDRSENGSHPARKELDRSANGNVSAPGEIIFFCGDQRRDELPRRLSEQGFRVREVLVYRTVLTPRSVEEKYEGIIFFSPSAVASYFSTNIPSPGTVLFAIGETTAEAIRAKCANTILVSDSPEKEGLVREAIRYFKSGNSLQEREDAYLGDDNRHLNDADHKRTT